ncbi:MAG: recombination protein NinG [Bacteroidales bacterium]|nr:recombination protein NinG [Bacteroidales bacterium]
MRLNQNHLLNYRENLVKKIGESRVLMLEARKNLPCKISDFEVKVLIDEYKRRIKEIDNC